MAATDSVVYVGCKMPAGVVLNLRSNEVDRSNGMAVVMTVGHDLGEFRLKGTARKFDQPDLSIDGYVFTKVPKDVWDEWIKRNAGSSLIRDGFIKAAAGAAQMAGMAREMEMQPGQFERITERDAKNKNRTSAELAARGAGLGVKKFDANDDRRVGDAWAP